nr:class I SAM-dependent methyltransferase [Allobranchiibius huperziae]
MLTGKERLVLDLGAGTGQISRELSGRTGLEVVAVEPDHAMRVVLTRRCPDVRVLDGTAEHIPLDDGSVDAVLVGSAWHWFDPVLAVPEVARVLRVGGRLAVVGSSPDLSHAWVAAMFGDRRGEHEAVNRHHYIDIDLPAPFGPLERYDTEFTQTLTPEGVQALFATSSRHLAGSDDEKAQLDESVQHALDEQFDDPIEIQLPMRARCWRSQRLRGEPA